LATKKSTTKSSRKTKAKTSKTTRKKKTSTSTKKKTKTASKKKTTKAGKKTYKFKNFFTSEPKLATLQHDMDPEYIVEAFEKVILTHASNHVRPGVGIDDLIGEGKLGVMKAIEYYNNPNNPPKSYTFVQYCHYKIREGVTQYCLKNASMIKTPYYIQRGCMHVAQIENWMQNQKVVREVLHKKGPASAEDIKNFLYNENERLPNKSKKFIMDQINKNLNKEEREAVYQGVTNHELGSKHSYIKKNLTDTGKVLHVKQKIWYTAYRNGMQYDRVIELIFAAKMKQTDLDPEIYGRSMATAYQTVGFSKLLELGSEVCGEDNFKIFLENKLYDRSYDQIAERHSMQKSAVTDIVKKCIRALRKNETLALMFKELGS
jgi:RNA polymerase sigma factor (sigma-70 family)